MFSVASYSVLVGQMPLALYCVIPWILAVTWLVVPLLWLVFDIAQMRAVGPRKHLRMRTFSCVGVSLG